MKKYQVIYADPPWQYDFACRKKAAIENKYPTMTQDELKLINIPAENNAVLYLWATAPKLLEAIDVINAWGFEYITHAVWDKGYSGMGYWFLGQHELLLVAKRGKFSPPKPNLRIASIFTVKKSKHSEKPFIVRHWINKWFPNMTKIELFARPIGELFEKEEGWDVWGNEVESDIEFRNEQNEKGV